MLVSMAELLTAARKENYGLAAPNIQSEDTARAVLEVAEELRAPMIIDMNYFLSKDAKEFVKLGWKVAELAEEATVPVCTNLDHGRNFDEIMWAIRGGFTSVMVDRSTLDLEENIRQTAEVVNICRPLGISVEAELGHVGRGNNYAVDGSSNLTDPEEARHFIEATGVDCLAVAVGTAHGHYTGEPHVDFGLLEEIVAACGDVPLVLHGGSGTGDENLARAVRSGIQKVNLASDLFLGGRKEMEKTLAQGEHIWQYDILTSFLTGYKESLAHYVKLFDQDHRA